MSDQKILKYAVVNPETGQVEGITIGSHLLVLLTGFDGPVLDPAADTILDPEKKWVWEIEKTARCPQCSGDFIEAPLIELSLGFCATMEQLIPPQPVPDGIDPGGKSLARTVSVRPVTAGKTRFADTCADPSAIIQRTDTVAADPAADGGGNLMDNQKYTACGIDTGPVAGLPFELLMDIDDAWTTDTRRPRLLHLQVDDAKHPFKIAPGIPIALPAGLHVLQIVGPDPYRSRKLTIDVADAPKTVGSKDAINLLPE